MDNPHLHTPLVRAGSDPASSRVVVILLHGRNQTPAYMLDLARRMDLPDFAYVAPSAAGDTWYPQGFMAPADANEPLLGHALARLETLVREIEATGRPRERIALVGFSQGACLACEYVHRHPSRWGALVGWTGGLIGPPEASWSTAASLAGTPIALGTSDVDTWVPLARVRQTAEVFRAMNAAVDLTIYPGMEHIVSDDEIERARRLLGRL